MACDWNGTLVDDRDRAWSATCTVLEGRGLAAPSLSRFLAEFRLPLASLFAHYGVPDGARDAIDDWNRAMAKLPVRAMPGARRMLERIGAARIPVAVVSAAAREVIERDLALLGLEAHVGSVFGDADPKREALTKLARAHEGSVAFIGDTEYDMREANAAGAIAIGFAGGYRPPAALAEAGAAHVVERLDELAALVTDGLSAPREATPEAKGGMSRGTCDSSRRSAGESSVSAKEKEA
ncbi:MAG TPA: HAD hydrolase-like protein [Gaiellaceae bacterium]|nr:HAD hydrolase-like protein [Gaiellaceae bacterium]